MQKAGSKDAAGGAAGEPVVPGIVQWGKGSVGLRRPRVLMLSHTAALTPDGASSVDWVLESGHGKLIAVMGPEHGFLGHAGAGKACRSFRHPVWQVPVYSLYGQTRAPRSNWLRNADVLLVDLQDLGYRPYTYVSTLYLALEAAGRQGLPVVVADRPIPLPDTVDGPMLDPGFESFVGKIPVPFCYGMTPAEIARWMQQNLLPDVSLTVLPMSGFGRHQAGFWYHHPWVSPSPAIRNADTAVAYPAMVGFEGLPHIDHGRHTTMPFQLIGAPWMEPQALSAALMACKLPGVRFHPHVYVPDAQAKQLPGIRCTVTDPKAFRPSETLVHLLYTLTTQYGRRRVWQHPRARPAFFDQLMGTDSVRTALLRGRTPSDILPTWTYPDFLRQREAALLYR